MSKIPFLKSNDIENFYEEGDRIIVEGIAADTSRDLVGDIATKPFLRKLASDLPGRSVFYNHNYKMPPIGRVLETKLMDDDNRLWAKCELYPNQDNLKNALIDGSLRFYSVGGVGSKVRHDVINGLPTRLFEDGYGQELTITSVPINPTASYIRVAKSQNNPECYNINELEEFRKSVQQDFGIDIIEERNRIMTDMEETFMKGNDGAIMNPERLTSGHISGGMDNLNGRGQQATPAHWEVPPDFKQMKAIDVMRKCWDEAVSYDDYANRVEFAFAKASGAYGYDRLNGTGQMPGQDNFGGADGFMARVLNEGLRAIARQAPGQPNYGTQPDDHNFLVRNIPATSLDYRGYDDLFVQQAANRSPLSAPDPLGTGRNPGVNPMDQEFLSRGMKPLPPAFRTNGLVNSGMTKIHKAQDLLENEFFLKSLEYSPYTGMKGKGNDESDVYYIWRMLHERGETREGSAFQKAIDDEITASIDMADFDNPTIEEAAILEIISQDPHLGATFYKCIENSIYAELEEEPETYEKGMPPWLNKDGDKDEDKDDDKDEKEDKKSDKKSKKEDKDDDVKKASDEEEEDEEEEEAPKKKMKKEDKDEDDEEEEEEDEEAKKSYIKSVITDSIREHLEKAQNETHPAGKVNPQVGVSTDSGMKLGRFEQGLLAVLKDGGTIE